MKGSGCVPDCVVVIPSVLSCGLDEGVSDPPEPVCPPDGFFFYLVE